MQYNSLHFDNKLAYIILCMTIKLLIKILKKYRQSINTTIKNREKFYIINQTGMKDF